MYTNNILRILNTGGLGQGLLKFGGGVVSGCLEKLLSQVVRQGGSHFITRSSCGAITGWAVDLKSRGWGRG